MIILINVPKIKASLEGLPNRYKRLGKDFYESVSSWLEKATRDEIRSTKLRHGDKRREGIFTISHAYPDITFTAIYKCSFEENEIFFYDIYFTGLDDDIFN